MSEKPASPFLSTTREQIDRAIMQLTLYYLHFPKEQWTEQDYATVPTLWPHKCNQDALDRAAKIEIRTGKPPCVKIHERQQTTHAKPDFDRLYMLHPKEVAQATTLKEPFSHPDPVTHKHEWNPLAALPNSDWQDVCITCGAPRIVKDQP